ncbi:9610_t:CDS:2 [Diversispora eburnea]|uniref:9610_t:CDS:1 n=1 Tax=Diversispora eburnea TaxID=1213867 RepID=A0A9N8W794_9GLOM|nr:9610_t:CDS:2 [Diversispora eburnea]
MNIGEKIIQFKALYKEYDSVIDDLRIALLDFLHELQEELDLVFIQVERIRQYLDDRGTLFRFLRRANFDFDNALRELMVDIRWRIDNNVDSLAIQDIHPLLMEKGLFFIHKTDRFNRPCAIFSLRKYVREDGFPTIDEIKKYIIFNAEVIRRLLFDRSRESRDGPVLQYVILLDLKGAGVSTLDSLNRIFFPSEKELLNYFDEENLLIEHGGLDECEYNLEICETFQYYGNPKPLLQIPKPLSRVTSFDSLHEVFFSAHTSPYHSRPSTPYYMTPLSSRPSTPYPSRPASPGQDYVSVPNWLKMTPRANPFFSTFNDSRPNIVTPKPMRSRQQFQFTEINPESSAITSHNHHSNYSNHNGFISPMTPIHSIHPIHQNHINNIVYLLLRLYTKLKHNSQRMLRRFLARRVTGVIYYLVMVVILRGGLANEFWKLLTQQISMQLGWNVNTTTALTTAALSAALNGRTGNRLLGF